VTLELVPWRGSRVPLLSQDEISRYDVAGLINLINANQGGYGGYMGPPMPTTTYGQRPVEPISNSFEGFVYGMLYVDGPVAAVEAYRLRVFGQAPLLYQEIVDGRAGDLFDDPALDRLRAPWAGATLSDLMKRALIYGDFAGNAFVADLEDELVLLRPDWVEIVLEKRMFRGQQVGWRQLGIVYYEGGVGRGADGVPFLPGEYAHFIPGLPDPLATYRGMSWLTPLVREVQADKSAMDHKVAYFENSASVNLAVSLPKEVSPTQFNEFVELMDSKHKGPSNAGKTLYTGGGADVTVIGSNMQQADFASIIGKGETRVANAGGVSPVLLSFSEGMQGSSLNAGNYTPAKRNFVDTTMRDLWANFAGSVGQMDAFRAPKEHSRLWYDGRDIPFLHEDAKDLAEIQQTRASTLSSYVTNGWKPESAIKAVAQDDITLLEHSGAFSVQLQPPGAEAQMAPDTNGNGLADDLLPPDGAPEPDFGALRADFWEFDEEDVLRAVEDLFDVDEDDLERARYDVRVTAGHEGGGRYRKLSDLAAALLQDWAKGDGGDDPLEGHFDRKQLLTILKDLRAKATADGDHARVGRLTPRRGATDKQLREAIHNDVRVAVRQDRDTREKPSAKFTLQGKAHRDLDVAVYTNSSGKPFLYRENDSGHQGSLVAKFDSLAELEAWADDQGEPRLADWARKESGAKAPAAKAPAQATKAPRKATALDPDALDARLRDAKPEDRRAILEEAATNQTQARRLASQLGVKGVSKLSRDEALDRVEAHYAAPAKKAAPTAAERAKAAKIASAFHEDWRKTRLQSDGTFEPRVKKTTDQAWIDAHGTDDVDIANSSYDELPDDWKAENKAAAEVVAGTPAQIIAALQFVASRDEARRILGNASQAQLDALAREDGQRLWHPSVARTLADRRNEAINTLIGRKLDSEATRYAGLTPAQILETTGQRRELVAMLDDPGKLRRLGLTRERVLARIAEGDARPPREGGMLPAVPLADLLSPPRKAAPKVTPKVSGGPTPAKLDFSVAADTMDGVLADTYASTRAPTPAKTVPTYELAPGYKGAIGRKRQAQADEALDAVAQGDRASFFGDTLEAVERLESMGYVRHDGKRWQVTETGRDYLDRKSAAFPKVSDGPSGKDVAPDGLDAMEGPRLRAAQVDDRIRTAYAEALRERGAESGRAVDLDHLRRLVGGDVSRTELDDRLRIMNRQRDIRLAAEANPKALTDESRAAAIRIGAQDKHAIIIEPPVPSVPDLTGSRGLSADPAVREVQVKNRIRAAYREVASRPFTPDSNMDLRPEWVRMADLREHPAIAELPRADQDRLLLRLVIEDGNAIPESAQWLLRPEDRAAALPMGGQRKHWLKLDDPSPRPLPSVPSPEAAARTRQVDIDSARRVADVLAEVQELRSNEAGPEVMRRTIGTRAQRDPGPDLQPIIDAVDTADPARIDAAISETAQRHGLTPTARVGDTSFFDPKRHQMVSGPRPAEGSGVQVRVLRPGYSYRRDGEDIALSKAVVEVDGLAPAKVAPAKAAKKAVPAKKLTAGQLAGMTPEDVAQAARDGRISRRQAAVKIRQSAQSAADFAAITGFGHDESTLTGPTADRKRRQAARVVELNALADEIEALPSPSPAVAKAARAKAAAKPAKVAKAPAGRAPAKPVPIHNLFTADDATIEAALRDVYEGKFGPYTTRVKVFITRAGTRTDKRGRVHAVDPSIGIDGEILDANGNKIGDFGRSISPADLHYVDGTVHREIWANHPIVQFYDKTDQGKGFGREFSQRTIEWYRASGVHGVSLHDHNGYVWAAQGFGFGYGGAVPSYLVENMRQLIADLRAGKTTSTATKDEYRTIPKRFRDAPDLDAQTVAAEALLARLSSTKPGEPGYPTAYEISQLGRRPSQRGKTALWLGKLLFVSTDELILNPDEGEVISQ